MIRITRHNILAKLLIGLVAFIIKNTNSNINQIKHKITRTNDIIYIASTPPLSNQISATPQIKNAKDNTLSAIPVIAAIFGLIFLKQQNKASIPFFIYKYILFF